ncbi:FkbM family methyltransferase [Halieaceae bacterium IMCC8485]|jgi:FkbM family methyltransferase|uniref:FkbM family methyltransferase n=1 Tax=Candidatus Seongchinamella marina TaxID=2518990 RepID=A0ABT3SUU4_9GAMM|nr:FkbM family methyltransferase [Candidatus Seongchinamella marina]MCX2973736.1 FkbM family methyltransferase [Candidatus Seongchinamella marina]
MSHFLQKLLPRPLRREKKTVTPKKLPAAQYQALNALKCRIWYNQYGGYCLPEASLHRTAPRKILRGEAYEPETIEFMRAHCRGGDVVHAGTYFGDFLPALSQACDSNCLVWAFEPNPENYRCAQITTLINALNNVQLQNAGLGDAPATLHMRTRDSQGVSLGGKSHLVVAGEFNANTDEDVRIVTIDSVVGDERPVSIIQLDVEDHEKAALSGALQTISRCLPIIILEVRKGSDLLQSEWFDRTIISLGYRQTATLHGNTVFEYHGES